MVTGLDATDPLAAVVAAEDARFAAMVVLERLRPDQRVAFVLHDGFAVPFAEVAEVLGTSEAAARQLASRARKAVTAQPALISGDPDPAHNEVVGRLMAAMAAGDLDTVVSLLHPDVTFTGDSNGKAPTAVRAVRGSDKVVRFILGLVQRYGPGLFGANQLALVNGELGAYGGLTRGRRVSGDGAADHRDNRARRKGVRAVGYRQSRQVHRLSAEGTSGAAHGTRQASPELKPCSVMPSAEFIRARMFSTPIW